MKTFNTISDIRTTLEVIKKSGKTVGFVPTMGTLHEGHLSLIRQSKKENDFTVCSIFVNPIQFNNKTDLEKYPRHLASDEKMLGNEGCDFIFAPSEDEMYPGGKADDIDIDFGNLERILEGKFRPGHFKGVAIVVKKLLDIVEPDKSYFGKKDYQQLLIIKELVKQLQIPTEIIPCNIVRESDGLAMSSRNLRLTIAEREAAAGISDILFMMRDKSGTLSVKELKHWALKRMQSNPAFRVEYLEIVDNRSLQPLENWKEKQFALACTAVYVGDVRLIDNLELFS